MTLDQAVASQLYATALGLAITGAAAIVLIRTRHTQSFRTTRKLAKAAWVIVALISLRDLLNVATFKIWWLGAWLWLTSLLFAPAFWVLVIFSIGATAWLVRTGLERLRSPTRAQAHAASGPARRVDEATHSPHVPDVAAAIISRRVTPESYVSQLRSAKVIGDPAAPPSAASAAPAAAQSPAMAGLLPEVERDKRANEAVLSSLRRGIDNASFCGRCGRERDAGSPTFCRFCGFRLSGP